MQTYTNLRNLIKFRFTNHRSKDNYLYLEKDYKQKLLQIPEFMKWLREKGRFLDAI